MYRHPERTSDINAPTSCAPAAGACCDAAILDERSRADVADRRLLATMATGRRSALARMHREYFSRLVRFFAHVMPTSAPEVVDDLIADTLFDVWQQCATFASESSVHLAIMRIAWTRVSARLAESSPEMLSGSRGEQGQPASRPEEPQPASAALEGLSPRVRAISHLVYSGHSRQEVADVLDIPCEAVDALLMTWRTAQPARLIPSESIATADQ